MFPLLINSGKGLTDEVIIEAESQEISTTHSKRGKMSIPRQREQQGRVRYGCRAERAVWLETIGVRRKKA